MAIETWWRDHAHAFTPREAAVLSVEALPDALRAVLPSELRPTFAIPTDLSTLLRAMDGRTWSAGRHTLWGTDLLVKQLAFEVRMHELDMITSGGAWLQVAQSGDHGQFFVSCDASARHFGQVIEGYDYHPWLDGGLLRGLTAARPVSVHGALSLIDWLVAWRHDSVEQ